MKEAEFRKLLALADGWQIWAFTPGTLAALQSGPSPGYHALALKRAADRGILVRAAPRRIRSQAR